MCTAKKIVSLHFLSVKWSASIWVWKRIFQPICCGLYCKAVTATDNLCSKQGNFSIFGFIFKSCFRSRAGYNGLLTVVSWSPQQAGLTSCIYLNWSLQKGLQFTSYSSIVIHNSTVHYFFPLFTNVRPYLIRFKVRSWESHKVFTDIFLSHNVNCKLLLPFRHGSFWAAGALSKKIEMDWCWSRKKILDGIKITILKGQQTRHHALQYSGLIFPSKLRAKNFWIDCC